MANTILHKRSTVSGKTPTAAQLSEGELAVNLADERVFMKNSAGTVIEVSYRDARSRSAISVNDTGGLGSVSYNSSTGVITYTGPTAAEVRSQLSAGSGISYDAVTGVVSVSGTASLTSLAVSGNISANSLTLAGDPTSSLQAATKQYVDNTVTGINQVDELSVTNDADIGGNLVVTGTATAPTFIGNVTGTVSSLSNHNTANLTEGTNLYYTDARARAAVSVTGDLSYNSTTGVISYTTPTTITGNAATATKLQTARTISGTSFDGSANITLSTTGITEGTNLYYTDARARAAVSVTDSGGDGSLSYNNSTGVITYTGPSAAEVRAHFSAGTGITLTNGVIALSQNISSGSSPNFAGLSVSGDTSVGGNLTVTGNLTINGTTTAINSNTLNIGDNLIVLNSDETGTPSQNAGIEVKRGTSTNVSLEWDETNDRWTVGSQNFVAGTFIGNLTGNVTGNVTGNITGSSGSTTGNAATATKLQTARTISGVAFDGSADITLTTTGITEGTNLYYTNARARAAISATGDLSYNSTTGVISYTTPTTITGNAATATKLQTARTISGTSFDGSANITLSTTGITEGTNLYYTDARSRAAHSITTGSAAYNSTTGVITIPGTTAHITESGNLYYTDARARAALSAGTGISYSSSTGVISSTITQYTDALARAAHSFAAGSGAYNSTTGVITIPTNTNQLTNGAGFVTSSGVTSVATGNGLTGGTITSTGTLSMSGSYSGNFAVSGNITATGEITAYFSDERLKTNIVEIKDALAKVEAIRGVEFDPNQTALDLGVDNQRQIGVIAQEVETVMPALIAASAFEGYKTVKYDKLTALLIQAVKELSAKITELESKLTQQQ
jgi:predicted RecA/RadA family phage recombinase